MWSPPPVKNTSPVLVEYLRSSDFCNRSSREMSGVAASVSAAQAVSGSLTFLAFASAVSWS